MLIILTVNETINEELALEGQERHDWSIPICIDPESRWESDKKLAKDQGKGL